MFLGDLIKQYRTINKLSLRDFASRCGLSHTYISALEKNIDPRTGKPIAPTLDTVKYVAKGMNISIEEILKVLDEQQEFIINQDLPSNHKDNSITSNSAIVFVYGSIPAGIPMECIEDIIDTEEIDADMLKGGKQYFGLRVKGNSMEPEYLDGDTLILEKADNCESGDDCVVMVNGNDGTFKRVFKDDKQKSITLQPLNMSLNKDGKPLYQPITFTNEQIQNLPVRIIGIVVEIRRKKKKK